MLVGLLVPSAASAPVTPQGIPDIPLPAGCSPGSCAGANLSGLDLSGYDFAGFSFVGAKLRRTNFTG